MTSPIAPWDRPEYRAARSRAAVTLIAFADREVVDADLELRSVVPAGAPVDSLDLRCHRYIDSPEWIDTWRTGAPRNIAKAQLGDLGRLDAARCCYSITIELDDPPDLTHLQLAWAAASRLAKAGCTFILDAHAFNWLPGPTVADLPPDREFAIHQEISVIAETEPTSGFGHPVHTRGMIKFARPDLIVGVAPDRIEQTGRILNHLALMLAKGNQLTPGQRLRFDGGTTLVVTNYVPDGTTPEVNLVNDGLLLVDA